MRRADPPPAVWLIPLLALLILPSMGQGPIGTRLAVLFTELLLGLPILLGTPQELRPGILPNRALTPAWRRALWLAPLPLAVLYQVLHLGVQGLLPPDPAAEATLRDLLTPGSPLEGALIGLSLLGLAPVMEEILYRGLLPWLWRRHLGTPGALWGPALLFAASHGSLRALPSLWLLGLALGWARERSGSLWPGMALHLAVNLTGWLAWRHGLGAG
ncbi:MAG: type II CAAX endopeptidase family protein [Candidatus Delongbacteria bacterium]